MFLRTIILLLCALLLQISAYASTVLIPMDEDQKDHLKSYGAAYWVLSKNVPVDWLLNYRGGSFAFTHNPQLENELIVRGISYQVMSDAQYSNILSQIADPEAKNLLRSEEATRYWKV